MLVAGAAVSFAAEDAWPSNETQPVPDVNHVTGGHLFAGHPDRYDMCRDETMKRCVRKCCGPGLVHVTGDRCSAPPEESIGIFENFTVSSIRVTKILEFDHDRHPREFSTYVFQIPTNLNSSNFHFFFKFFFKREQLVRNSYEFLRQVAEFLWWNLYWKIGCSMGRVGHTYLPSAPLTTNNRIVDIFFFVWTLST